MQRCNLYGFVLCVLCVWLVFSISICMRLGCMPAAFSFIAHQANVGEKNKNPNITQTMPHKCSSKKHQSPPSVTERYSFLFLLLFFFFVCDSFGLVIYSHRAFLLVEQLQQRLYKYRFCARSTETHYVY